MLVKRPTACQQIDSKQPAFASTHVPPGRCPSRDPNASPADRATCASSKLSVIITHFRNLLQSYRWTKGTLAGRRDSSSAPPVAPPLHRSRLGRCYCILLAHTASDSRHLPPVITRPRSRVAVLRKWKVLWPLDYGAWHGKGLQHGGCSTRCRVDRKRRSGSAETEDPACPVAPWPCQKR